MQVLEFEKTDDSTCLICGEKSVIQKMKIMRTKRNENLVSFPVCEKCLKIMETNLSGYLEEMSVERVKKECDKYTIYFTYPRYFAESTFNQNLLNRVPYYIDHYRRLNDEIDRLIGNDNRNGEIYCQQIVRLNELRKDLRRLFTPYSISVIKLCDSEYEVTISK